jgi:hypothetical protein
MIIPWSKVPNFLDGECNRPKKQIFFFLKKATSIPPSSPQVPRISSCLTMSTYHCAFGPKDQWVEFLVVD